LVQSTTLYVVHKQLNQEAVPLLIDELKRGPAFCCDGGLARKVAQVDS